MNSLESKIIVKRTIEMEEGTQIDVPKNASLHFSNGQAYIMEVASPEEAPSEATDQDLDHIHEENEEEDEFKKKWQIRTGLHMLHSDHGMIPVPVAEEKYFDTQTSKKLVDAFDLFYKNIHIAHKYKRLKRSYLLHSLPGMGKSALIRKFCREALKKEGTAILQADGEINFNLLNHIFIKEYHEDVKLIVLIVEDMGKKDHVANMHFYNASCLNFLDGHSGLFRVPTLIICTTNYAKELGPHFTNRPGRFNKIIRVDPPTDEEVFELVEGFGGMTLTEPQKDAFKGKSLTPDHCIEAIIRHELEEIDLIEAIGDVLREREGLVNFDI